MGMARDREYAAECAVRSAEKYKASQRRQRLVLIGRKGDDELPANCLPALTYDVHVSAGETLRRWDKIKGTVITCQMLEKVKMRAGMTKEQVGAMDCRPRNVYRGMNMREPSWTLTS